MVKIGSTLLSKLVKFGLTKQEVETYGLLLEKGSVSIKDLASEMGVLPNALYRVLDRLIKKGLVHSYGNNPTIYSLISPSVGLDILAKQKISELEEVKKIVIDSLIRQSFPTQETNINFLKGKDEFFRSYVKLAKQAKKEILVISVGEPISDEMKIINRDAIANGVDFKFIPHKYDRENQELLRSYVKMGWQTRHFPGSGFHLVVIDGKKSILAISNPKHTDDRIAFEIYSDGLSKAFRDYFYSVWEKASPIDPI